MSPAHTVALLAGRYRLDQPIASGGVGEVWRGTDVFLARPVAVKLLHPELAADDGTLARFRDSARRTGSLVHEGITRIYDYIEPGPSHPPLLVMEFVDGPSLATAVAGGPSQPRRVMDVVAQAADALYAAHQAGLMHGGLKPANVLLSRDGVAKLTDFGMAAGPGTAAVTNAGAMVGDLAYLAPERGKEAGATAAGDLYSLGVVAYQCLTGDLPSSGISVEDALARRDGPAPALPSGVAAEVAALIDQLTAIDPADRPSDARQVARQAGELRDRMTADDTRQLGGGAAVTPPSQHAAEAPTVPWRREKRKRHGRRILLAATAATAAIAAFLLTSVMGTQDGSHVAALAPAKHRSVEVNGTALRGQSVKAVRRQLRHLGLEVRVRWLPSSRLSPGTVISVRPTGHVATGTTIVVIGALPPTGTGPAQSTPISSPQPQPAHKARHGKAHPGGRPHSPAPPTPTGSPTAPSSPTPTGSPTPTVSPTPTPTAPGR